MEGFLLKKSKERSFGTSWLTDKSKSWNRRWFELEDQTVTYYQDFDLMSNQPIYKKGSYNIKDCEVLPVSHKTKKYIFCVKNSQTTLFYVQAEDAKLLGVWIRALTAAAKGEHNPPELDYDSFYVRLGLDPEEEHEPSAVNRAFRQLALQDSSSGKPERFKELQEAFNHIMARLNDLEESRTMRMAYYEAVIIKGGPGVGMGIVVQEEPNGDNVVQSVRDTLRIESITGEVGEDGIEEGDQLLKIGNVDVSHMPLVRVAQRMNDFRIPPGSRVKLTFGRKVFRENDDEENEYLEGNGYFEHLDREAIAEHQRQFDNNSRDGHMPSESDAVEAAAGIAERAPEQVETQMSRSLSASEPAGTMHGLGQSGLPQQLQVQNPSSFAAANDIQNNPNLQRSSSIDSVNIRNDTNADFTSPQPRSRSPSPGPPQQISSTQSVPFSSARPPSGRNSPSLRPPSGQRSPSPPVTRELNSHTPSVVHNPPVAGPSTPPEVPPRPLSPASTTSATSPAARPFSLPVSALRSVSSFRSSLSPKPSFWKASAPAARSNSVASMRDMAASGKGLNATNPKSPTDTSPGSSKGGGMVDMINTKEYFILSSMQAKTPAEIAEMKRDLDFCLKELQVASKRIESLEFHNAHLTEDLARYKALYADSARHERLLETQLEQYLLHSTVTAEFIEESMNDMIYVSNQISANEPVPVSESTNVYLDELGLGEMQSEMDGSKASQRSAIAAAAAVDRSGLMLQKWAMTCDSIMDKLNRFEETVQQIDGIHKSASELRKAQQQVQASALAAAPDPAVSLEEYSSPLSPPQYNNPASIRQPQQYRAPGSASLTSPQYRSAAASHAQAQQSGASSSLPRKASTPNAYGQVSQAQHSPKRSTNGYGLREYTPSTNTGVGSPTLGSKVSTEPYSAKLGRQASLHVQPVSAQYNSTNGYPAPMERASSLSKLSGNEKGAPKPLLSTLMSRPLK